ncbi:hypothetical protein GCM10017784_34130 [Deinococcus indicus]|nr:hypothetical protein GCM10017784_34130 [Deinococcus indicus]
MDVPPFRRDPLSGGRVHIPREQYTEEAVGERQRGMGRRKWTRLPVPVALLSGEEVGQRGGVEAMFLASQRHIPDGRATHVPCLVPTGVGRIKRVSGPGC